MLPCALAHMVPLYSHIISRSITLFAVNQAPPLPALCKQCQPHSSVRQCSLPKKKKL